jgi:hypothetical protein
MENEIIKSRREIFANHGFNVSTSNSRQYCRILEVVDLNEAKAPIPAVMPFLRTAVSN